MNKIFYVYCDKEINDFEGLSKVLPLLLKQCYIPFNILLHSLSEYKLEYKGKGY